MFTRLAASPLNFSTTLFQLSAPSSLARRRCTARTAKDDNRSSLTGSAPQPRFTRRMTLKLRSQPAVLTGTVTAIIEHSSNAGRAASYGVRRLTI